MCLFRVSLSFWMTLFLETSSTVKVQSVEVPDSGINNKTTCPTSCLNSRCHFNNSREICTDGCEEGRRGDNCSIDCPPKCSDCNKYTGGLCNELCLANCESGCDRHGWHCASCKPGFKGRFCDTCVKGFTGIHCNETCPEYCYDGCERDSGFCYWRDEAYRGRYCRKTSSTLCHTCSRRTGKCKLCYVGYHQASCEKCAPRCVRCVRRRTECLRCIDGYRGEKCTLSCPANCKRCDITTGECLLCITGYRGEHCNLTCPTNCDQCDTKTGTCRQCTDGYLGDRCNLTCPTKCVSCKTATGQCTACRNGYRGKYCNMPCSPLCKLCDQVTGDCYGCKTGYLGGYCNETCPSNCKGGCDRYTGTCDTCVDGHAGRHCFSTCSSDCEICEFDTGQCVGCKKGKMGRFCNESCPSTCVSCDLHRGECMECRPGYRGKYCHCDNNCATCDQLTGQCGHCIDGRKGHYCNETCPTSCTQCERYGKSCKGPCANDSYYGETCSIPCSNSCIGCEKTTGSCVECARGYSGVECEECAHGYSRVYCDQMCVLCSDEDSCISKPCVQGGSQWLWMVLVGTFSTISIVGISVLVGVKLAKTVRRPEDNHEEQGASDPPPAHEYHMPSNHYNELDYNDLESDPAVRDPDPHPPRLPVPRPNSSKTTMQNNEHMNINVPVSSPLSNCTRHLHLWKENLNDSTKKKVQDENLESDPLSLPPALCPRRTVKPKETHVNPRIQPGNVSLDSNDVHDSDLPVILPLLFLQPSLSQSTSQIGSGAIQKLDESTMMDSDRLHLTPQMQCRRSLRIHKEKTNINVDYVEDSSFFSPNTLLPCGLPVSNPREYLQGSKNLDSDDLKYSNRLTHCQHCPRPQPPSRTPPRNPKKMVKEVQEPIHPFVFEADEVFENPLYKTSAVSSKNAYEMVELDPSHVTEEQQGYRSTVSQFEVEWRNLQASWPAPEATQRQRLLHRRFSDSYLLRFDSKPIESNSQKNRSMSDIIRRGHLKFEDDVDAKCTYISPVIGYI